MDHQLGCQDDNYAGLFPYLKTSFKENNTLKYIGIMENGDLMHKVIGCEHGLEGLSMEQSGTPREREHKMTLTPSRTLSMKDKFPNRLQVLTESSIARKQLPTESISSQDDPCPPQNHPSDGGLLFLTGLQVSQTMTFCTRAP